MNILDPWIHALESMSQDTEESDDIESRNRLLKMCAQTLRDAQQELELLSAQYKQLLDSAKSTLRKNLHLADGDECTLLELREAVKRVAPEWDMDANDK